MQNILSNSYDYKQGGTIMQKRRNFFSHMMTQTVGTPNCISELPIIEIAGAYRVLIENHQGIAAYGKEWIQINVKYGKVCVNGNRLEVIRMTKEQLVIHGTIHSIELQRRR